MLILVFYCQVQALILVFFSINISIRKEDKCDEQERERESDQIIIVLEITTVWPYFLIFAEFHTYFLHGVIKIPELVPLDNSSFLPQTPTCHKNP